MNTRCFTPDRVSGVPAMLLCATEIAAVEGLARVAGYTAFHNLERHTTCWENGLKREVSSPEISRGFRLGRLSDLREQHPGGVEASPTHPGIAIFVAARELR
jgi:hypothetical protein